MKTDRQIAIEYFDSHPEAKADATRKGMLLLRPEFRASHHYEHKNRETKCWVCGQDWYAKDFGYCSGFKRTEPEDMPEKICRILNREHQLYMETIARCERMVKSEHKDWSTLTGEKIAVLHHTHGCGPEELEWILNSDMPKSLRAEYDAAMEVERNRSRTAQVKQVIAVTP